MRSDLFLFAFRNLGKRKKRAALTMIGVFIGIAAVVALIALGQGLQQTINEQFEKVGADKIIIQAKEVGFGGSTAPGQLKERELNIAQKVAGVSQTAGIIFRSTRIQYNRIQRTMYASSVPETPKEAALAEAVYTWEIEEGRLLTHKDKNKIVIGSDLANKKLFKRNIQIGDSVLANEEKFKVVGILKRMGDPGVDGGVVLPEENMRIILDEPEAYSMIVAQAAQGADPEAIAERIKKKIRRERHQKEGKEDFLVQTSTELIESFNQVLNIVQVVFVGIAAISLLVGGIGIMNTMYTSVLERTKEIGVMKSIGARNKDILGLFLIESALLGLAGGIIGVVIGVVIATLIELGVNSAMGAGTIAAAFPVWLIVGVLLFSTVVGALSGILPARRASKLKPVEALRYE